MRRVIGLDIHRTFAEAVAWEDGRLIRLGRLDMTRTALEGFGKSLRPSDEVVVEATGNAMAVVRVLSPFVARVIVANPLQVKAIAHAHVKTDKIDAGVLASLHAAGFLPEVWTPDPETERLRVVRHRTRIKNEVHSILHAHLIPRCPHADLFNRRGRDWLSRQPLPVDEKATIDRHVRELDRLAEDLDVLDREVAQGAIGNPSIERLITITGVNLTVAAGLVAAIGDIRRFTSPQKLVSYVGLNPRVRQSGLGLAQHGPSARSDAAMRARCWWRPPGLPRRRPDRFTRSSSAFGLGVATRSPPWRWLASWPSCAGTFSRRKRTISGRDPRWWPSRSGAWSSKPVSRPRRGINAVRPMPTTSRHSEIGRCSSRPRPSGLTSTSSANGGREDQARECASASIRPGTNDQAA